MPDVRAQLIIAARDETSDAARAASDSIRNVVNATKDSGTAAQDSGLRLTELWSAYRIGTTILRDVKGAYDNVVGSTLTYSDQVRKLSRDIGASAEDSSKLIYAANVVGINVDQMAKSFDMAINKMRSHRADGIAPNIEGLGILADKYNALQDPIARTQFLIDNFGRSGANLAPLMALGSKGIKDLGDQAQAAGVVLDSQATGAMYRYEQETKVLNASLLGLKISFTEAALPALQSMAQGLTDRIQTLTLFKQAVDAGKLSMGEAAGVMVQWLTNITSGGATVQFLNEKLGGLKNTLPDLNTFLNQNTTAQNQLGLASGYAAQLAGYQTTATKELSGRSLDLAMAQTAVSDAANKAADAEAKLKANADPKMFDGLQAGADRAKAALEASRDALQKLIDAPAVEDLKAGMAGKLGTAMTNYGNVIESNGPKLAKLRDELARLEASQGAVVTATAKGKMSQEDYQLLVDRTALALTKYNEALAGTIDKHGKLHASTADHIEATRITWQGLANALDDANGNVQTSSTFIVDNTTKIAALKAQIDPLVDAENKARDAILKTGEQMAYQAASSGLSVEAQTKMARSLGLVSEADYSLISASQTLQKQYLDGKISIDQLNAGLNALVLANAPIADVTRQSARAMENLAEQTGNAQDAAAIFQGAMPTMETATDRLSNSFGLLSGDLHDTARGYYDVKTEMDNHTKAQSIAEGSIYRTGKSFLLLAGEAHGAANDIDLVRAANEKHTAGMSAHEKALERLKGNFLLLAGEARGAAKDIDSVRAAEAALYDKTITINIRQVYTQSGDVFTPPARAEGGPVAAGKPYTVGERGPELFIPRQDGVIVPNSGIGSPQAAGMPGAGAVQITNIINDRLAAALVLENQRRYQIGNLERVM